MPTTRRRNATNTRIPAASPYVGARGVSNLNAWARTESANSDPVDASYFAFPVRSIMFEPSAFTT